MDIQQIEAYLKSSDPQERLKALVELRHYDAEVAVPLLKSRIKDQEFLVRSFVAMGLGNKQTDEAYNALLELLHGDRDPNVRAEAANSLSKYGEIAIPHLISAFAKDEHWLIRRSILAAMTELNHPQALYEVCLVGIQDEDLPVREESIGVLVLLAGTPKQEDALQQLLSLVKDEEWRIRARLARTLGKFNDQRATDALRELQGDEDHRVVGAVLDSLL